MDNDFLNSIHDQSFAAGLAEAKRRLGIAGMHDGRCPEPDKPCNCGIDAAIDAEFPPYDPAADGPYGLREGMENEIREAILKARGKALSRIGL